MALAAAAIAAGIGLAGAAQVHWDDRPWEVAARQVVSGQNPYALNLHSRQTSEEQTGWPYGPLSLYAAVPLYLATRPLGARPDAFAALCALIALAAHLLLARQAWLLAGSGWRGSVAAVGTLLNPFLLRLDVSGDILDAPMLLALLAAVRAQEQGRPRTSALWLGLSIAIKQLGLLYLPFWLRRESRSALPLVLALALPSLPFLAWDPPALLFALSGASSAYRNFVQLDWWNMFGFELRAGVPAALLRVISYVLSGLAVLGIALARIRPLSALTLSSACAWIAYYSAYSLYLGWWSVLALLTVAASL